MSKRGLSLEQHAAIGAELIYIQAVLADLGELVGAAYPLNRRVNKLQVAEVLGELRAELDNEMYRQHHQAPYPSCYYGAGQVELAERLADFKVRVRGPEKVG